MRFKALTAGLLALVILPAIHVPAAQAAIQFPKAAKTNAGEKTLAEFSAFSNLYSVHIFTEITIHGDDAILVCTGGLFGVA